MLTQSVETFRNFAGTCSLQVFILLAQTAMLLQFEKRVLCTVLFCHGFLLLRGLTSYDEFVLKVACRRP